MSAASTSQDNKRKDGIMEDAPVLAGQKLYKGRPVFLDSSSKYAQTNDGATITLAAGDVFAGICVETIDNSSGSNGDKDVRIYKTGSFLMEFSDTLNTVTSVGAKVYVNNTSDDAVVTVTQDTGNAEVCIGVITSVVDTSHAYVRIDRYVDTIADTAAGDLNIPDGSIGTVALAADCVTSAKIADDQIDSEHIAAGAVDQEHMANDSVALDELNIVVHTVTVTASTTGTATVTSGAQILGFYTTAITGSENVKLVDISGTTLTVTLTGSDTATVKVVVLEPSA